MNILGPKLDAAAQCEAILRSLPTWFGIEEALLMYARDSTRLPKTIAATHPDAGYTETRAFYERVGFAPLEVFPELWSARNPCLQMVKTLG